jgi:hypothetical protein
MYDLKTFTEAWQNMRAKQDAENQHLLETLGITIDNIEDYKICVNDKGEIIKVLRVMKATIWEKKQNAN